jgi:hypothetical protein
MIECARFLKDINKRHKDHTYEHILQDEINLPKLKKKTKRVDIIEKNDAEDIFDTDWRSKY